jgi:hypothetical protein
MITRSGHPIAWKVVVAGVGVTAVLGAAVAPTFSRIQRHRQFCDEARQVILSLLPRKPAHLTPEQWNCVVGWTINGLHNTVGATPDLPPAELDRVFAELLMRTSRETVDLATIDWIWDQIVRLAPNGQNYSDRFRPTTPERLADFKEGRNVVAF